MARSGWDILEDGPVYPSIKGEVGIRSFDSRGPLLDTKTNLSVNADTMPRHVVNFSRHWVIIAPDERAYALHVAWLGWGIIQCTVLLLSDAMDIDVVTKPIRTRTTTAERDSPMSGIHN